MSYWKYIASWIWTVGQIKLCKSNRLSLPCRLTVEQEKPQIFDIRRNLTLRMSANRGRPQVGAGGTRVTRSDPDRT
jgi:hypothetical protein